MIKKKEKKGVLNKKCDKKYPEKYQIAYTMLMLVQAERDQKIHDYYITFSLIKFTV